MAQPQTRGDILYIDLGYPIGHEAGYTRPGLVISNDQMYATGLLIVLPITRTRHGWPSHVEVEPAESGLHETSYIQTEQIRTISTERVVKRIGQVGFMTLSSVEILLKVNLALQ